MFILELGAKWGTCPDRFTPPGNTEEYNDFYSIITVVSKYLILEWNFYQLSEHKNYS
jgi:hypothetical protein